MTTRWKTKGSCWVLTVIFIIVFFWLSITHYMPPKNDLTSNSTIYDNINNTDSNNNDNNNNNNLINLKEKIINLNNNYNNNNINENDSYNIEYDNLKKYNKFDDSLTNHSDFDLIRKMIQEERKIYNELDRVKNFNLDINRNDTKQVFPDLNSSNFENSHIEYIKLSKIHNKPLHKDDLLYESERNKSITDDYYKGYKTGNFRNRSSKIWDPHPEYIIDVFGKKIHLMLYQDTSFVHSNFKVTHVYENQKVHIPDTEEDRYHLECYYKGRVKNDENGVVAVSLCNGMTGHIRTSFGSFFIEPTEEYTKTDTALMHKIWREIGQHHILNDVNHYHSKNNKNSNCPIGEHNNINNTDDERPATIENHHQRNYISNNNGSNESTIIEETNNSSQNRNRNNSNEYDYNQQYDHQQQFNNFPPQQETFPINQNDNPIAENIVRKRKKRNTFENQYTLEVLVAVDGETLNFHSKDYVKDYVLTLMGVVSSIFADASIGNSINVVVTEIVKLETTIEAPKFGPHGVSAPHYLKKFCHYIDKAGYHYDTAVLITRHTICRNDSEIICNTLGLAELGTACKKNSCSVVVDNGLNTAFTIAHELGHIFNAPHDDDEEKCNKYNTYGSQQMNIMSSTMAANIHPWTWSSCSRGFIDEFLEKEDVSCMKTSARKEISTTSKLLPGELYSLDEQCRLIMGPQASLCTSVPQDCRQLFCYEYDKSQSCASNGPWADGTPCDGRNVNPYRKSHYWCQKGECVSKHIKLIPKDGGWSPWSQWSECSRSCGGGVQQSHRECNNPSPKHGGKYCVGSKRQYRSCNTMECPETDMDFREKQCADFNNNNFEIRGLPKNVRWIAKYGVNKRDECKLFCRTESELNYFKLADKVIDGTTCSYESFNKCVNGACQPAACDNELNSSAKVDRCGVCNGQNDTCRKIIRDIRIIDIRPNPELHNGSTIYYHVADIPKGASNIEIVERHYRNLTFIALLDDNQKAILNGDNHIDLFKKQFPYGGVNFEYSGSIFERVNTTYSRKLKKSLSINLIVMPSGTTIDTNSILLTYSYDLALNHHYHQYNNINNNYNNINNNNNNYNVINNNNPTQSPSSSNDRRYSQPQQNKIEIYKWELDEWGPCNSKCQGKSIRSLVCVNINAGLKVSSTYCDKHSKPSYTELERTCNDDCELIANITSVSECSASCGSLGTRNIKYSCIQRYHTGAYEILDLPFCHKLSMPQYEECREGCWDHTIWSECSRTCGGGQRTRRAFCKYNGQEVDEKQCNAVKRQNIKLSESCNNEPCPDWVRDDPHLACSVTCGIGQQTIDHVCMQNNKIVDNHLCSDVPKPSIIIVNCTMPPCPTTTTTTTTTSTTTTTPRSTLINQYTRNNKVDIYYNHHPYNTNQIYGTNPHFPYRSPYQPAYDISNSINSDEDPPAKWEVGEWSECNNKCERNRTVQCNVPYPHNCPMKEKPINRKRCCNIKYVSRLSACSADCGSGVRTKEFYCAKVYKLDEVTKKREKKPIDEIYCRDLKKPKPSGFTKPCKINCHWKAFGDWSECRSDCKEDYSKQTVVCINKENRFIPHKYCDSKNKPVIRKICPNCNKIRTEEKLNPHCHCDGYKKKRLICYDSRNKIIPCPAQYRTISKIPCTPPPKCHIHPRSCRDVIRMKHNAKDGDYNITIKNRLTKIYCHNMTKRPTEYITVDEVENYSVYYEKRARDLDSCSSHENDEFTDPNISYGSTMFRKIRLDLSHPNRLKIITDDYTFATIRGNAQPYGSAGDCYNKNKRCPKGHFSINLLRTGFRILRSTKWDSIGHDTKMDFRDKLQYPYQIVRGLCGGYCGQCVISKDTGLIVDVI